MISIKLKSEVELDCCHVIDIETQHTAELQYYINTINRSIQMKLRSFLVN